MLKRTKPLIATLAVAPAAAAPTGPAFTGEMPQSNQF